MSKLRANQIVNKASTGAPTAPNGLVVTGVSTATSFSGSGANLTALNAGNVSSGTLPTTRGGTGLTSLGSAGQAIKVNSSGNGLEYGTAGGMVKLYEYSSTGGSQVSSFTVNGYFDDSKYMHYRAIISDLYTPTTGNANNPNMRFCVSNSPVTSSNYVWAFHEAYGSGHHQRGSGTGGMSSSISQLQGTWACRGNTYELQNFDIIFFNPTTTGLGAKFIKWTGHCFQHGDDGNRYTMSHVATGGLMTTSALTGFQIYSADSSNFTYKISLYGILK